MDSTTRVLIADEQPLFVSGVRTILAQANQFKFVGQADTPSRCLRLLEAESPDVLLIDSNICGIEAQLDHGILELVLPKSEEAKPAALKIEVN